MTEIHLLPVCSTQPDQVRRLHADLLCAYESGADLGSRVPHIHAAEQAFRHLSDRLRTEIATLSRYLAGLSVGEQCQQEIAVLQQLIDQVEALASFAKRFPAAHPEAARAQR